MQGGSDLFCFLPRSGPLLIDPSARTFPSLPSDPVPSFCRVKIAFHHYSYFLYSVIPSVESTSGIPFPKQISSCLGSNQQKAEAHPRVSQGCVQKVPMYGTGSKQSDRSRSPMWYQTLPKRKESEEDGNSPDHCLDTPPCVHEVLAVCRQRCVLG